jgi:hypothetical protein
MTIQRMDNILIVVEDIEAAKAFSPNSVWSWKARRRSRGLGGQRRRARRRSSRHHATCRWSWGTRSGRGRRERRRDRSRHESAVPGCTRRRRPDQREHFGARLSTPDREGAAERQASRFTSSASSARCSRSPSGSCRSPARASNDPRSRYSISTARLLPNQAGTPIRRGSGRCLRHRLDRLQRAECVMILP